MPPVYKLVGQKFGRLTVLRRVENSKSRQSRWRCGCECGNETDVVGYCLLNGQIKSCGCLRRELTTKRGRSRRTRQGSARYLKSLRKRRKAAKRYGSSRLTRNERKRVLERDGYQCQVTGHLLKKRGTVGRIANVHHIKGHGTNECKQPENLVSLCASWHQLITELIQTKRDWENHPEFLTKAIELAKLHPLINPPAAKDAPGGTAGAGANVVQRLRRKS